MRKGEEGGKGQGRHRESCPTPLQSFDVPPSQNAFPSAFYADVSKAFWNRDISSSHQWRRNWRGLARRWLLLQQAWNQSFLHRKMWSTKKIKQTSFLTPLLSQSSQKGLERSDTISAQFFISLQILPKIFEFMVVSMKILEHISALKPNRC